MHWDMLDERVHLLISYIIANYNSITYWCIFEASRKLDDDIFMVL